MCFHSKQTKSATEVENRFKAKIDNRSLFQPKEIVNGFDFPLNPIITDENPETITHYHWGLIPSWSKDEEIKKHTLNARIETITEKPAFQNSVNQRCLVLANGFYEWQWHDSKGKNKSKFEIGIENEALFAFAGLYAIWRNPKTGELKNTYTLVTTAANSVMAEIHNIKKRMPVILRPEDEQKWLQHEPIQKFSFPYEVNLVAKNLNFSALF